MIRKLLTLNFIVWVTTFSLICQSPSIDPIIYTPRGIAIEADYFIGDDYTFYEADSINNDYVAANPKAILIGSVTRKYNCHGYAWHKIEGGIDVWVVDQILFHRAGERLFNIMANYRQRTFVQVQDSRGKG